jgi:hypothetical protein
MTVEQLAKHRGERWTQEPAKAGTIARALAAEQPPNVILLMRNSLADPEPELTSKDGAALTMFLAAGGRLIVLDDWGLFGPVLDALTGVEPSASRARVAAPRPSPRGLPSRPSVDRTEVPDAAVEALVARFARRGARAETATIVRDGTHRAGLAVRVRFGADIEIAR